MERTPEETAELEKLVAAQYKDQMAGQRQFPEDHVVMSLDAGIRSMSHGGVETLGDMLDTDGVIHWDRS